MVVLQMPFEVQPLLCGLELQQVCPDGQHQPAEHKPYPVGQVCWALALAAVNEMVIETKRASTCRFMVQSFPTVLYLRTS